MTQTLRPIEREKLRELLDRCEYALRESEGAAGEALSLLIQVIDISGSNLDGLIPVGRRHQMAVREIREVLSTLDENLITLGLVTDPVELYDSGEMA